MNRMCTFIWLSLVMACGYGYGEAQNMNTNLGTEFFSTQYLAELQIETPFYIEASKVAEILQKEECSLEELLHKLIPVAKSYARPPISNYRVGAVGLGKSGAIYLGVNLEFEQMPLSASIHAEQFLVINARNHHESELVSITLPVAPCGHCRQFLLEMGNRDQLQIAIGNTPARSLDSLVPEPFGPEEIGIDAKLMEHPKRGHAFTLEYSLRALAWPAALDSYAPYSLSKSGVSIQIEAGKIYSGSYLENAAFNPSVSPLQAALVALVADLHDYSEIKEVMLVEMEPAQTSQKASTTQLLNSIAPHATLFIETKKYLE